MASQEYLFAPSSQTTQRNYQFVLIIATLAAGLLLMMVTAAGLLREIAMLGIMAVAALAVWRWPTLSAAFLVAFTPVNRFVIFLGFSFIGSETLLRATQLWKDGIIAVLLAKVVYEALVRRRWPRIYILDLLIGMFIAFNLVYILYPGTLPDNTLTGRVLGFRLDAYFLFAYFAGRGLTLKREHVRWIVMAMIPGSILVGLVAVWQFFFPGAANDLWDSLGYQSFVDAVRGSSNIAVRTRDLAGVSIPRASSLLMSDLALAFFQLLTIPFAAALLLVQRRTSGTLQWGAAAFLVLMLATMALSGTRSAILAVPITLGVLILWTKSYGKAIAAGVAMLPVLAILLLIFSSGGTGDWFESLISTEEGSIVAHSDALERSVQVIRDEPLGQGLGSSHTVGFQLGLRESFATESWYLQIGTETGILGMILYSLVIVAATVTPLLAYSKLRDPWLRALALGAGGAGVGFLLVGVVLHVWEAPVIAAVFWLLIGIAVRGQQLEEQWAQEEAEAT